MHAGKFILTDLKLLVALKRALKGTYVNVEPFIFVPITVTSKRFEFNERKDDDAGRFVKACAGLSAKDCDTQNLSRLRAGDGIQSAGQTA